MSKRDDIIVKAFARIDEIYPDNNEANVSSFNVDAFVDEAARWVILTAPIHALGHGTDFSTAADAEHVHNDDGSGSVKLPQYFLRLIAFRMSDWPLPIIGGLYDDNARYRQQHDAVLRGTPSRPAVFICDGGQKLEYYSSHAGTIKEARCFAMQILGDDYPDMLSDITAWKIAELVLSAMNDINGVQICQNNIKDLLRIL